MKNLLLLLLFITTIFFSCENKNNISSNNIYENDSLFAYSGINIHEHEKRAIIQQKYFYTKIIGEKIIIHLIDGNRCFIKEYTCSGFNRFFFVFNDYFSYAMWPDYPEKFEDKKHIFGRKLVDSSFISKLSDKFWNIPELREPLYIKKKEPNDIKKIEELINNLDIFNDFSLDSDYHKKILSELFIFTQISIMSLDDKHANMLYNLENTIRIESNTDIEFLEFYLNRYDKFMENKWEVNNRKYIKSVLPTIKKELASNSVMYFYTVPDLKLFRLTIKIDSDKKIVLNKKYMNKKYMWFDSFYFFPEIP